MAVLLARHGWPAERLAHALGLGEHAAADSVARARRIAETHGRHRP